MTTPTKKPTNKKSTPGPDNASIRQSDFESLEARVTFRNRTSKFDIGENEYRIAREFRDKGLVFDVPRKSCALGHSLDFELTIAGTGKQDKMVGAGKVVELDAIDSELQSVTIEFFQYSEEDWNALRTLYATKQEEMLELFRTIRGY